MRVYISGKIGEESPSPETLAKFKRAEDMLKGKGYKVFNPTKSGLGRSADLMRHVHIRLAERIKGFCDLIAELDYFQTRDWYSCILLLDLGELSWCDSIYMLPDWKQSPGATVEYYYAIATKKKLLFGDKGEAALYLFNEWHERNKEKMGSIMKAILAELYVRKKIHEVWLPINHE